MKLGKAFEGLSRAERRYGALGVLLVLWTLGWLGYIAYHGFQALGGTP